MHNASLEPVNVLHAVSSVHTEQRFPVNPAGQVSVCEVRESQQDTRQACTVSELVVIP